MQRKGITNTSGHPGVSWNKGYGKWRARISVKGEQIYLGSFVRMEDAIAAKDTAELEHLGSPLSAVVCPNVPGMKFIKLTQGRIASVDIDLFEWLNQRIWYYDKRYVQHKESGVTVLMHIAIMKHMRLWTPGLEVDHINSCPCDNRLVNLRMATGTQNNMNTGLRSDSTSGVTGVSWNKHGQKWISHIGVDGKVKHLGRFTDKDEAIAARVAAEIEHFGEFRHDPTLRCPLWKFDLCPDCAKRAKDQGIAA